MAKKSQPWFWAARNSWYVTVRGKQHLLGEHPKDAAKAVKSKKTGRWNSPKAIDEVFRQLLGGGTTAPQAGDAVATILDDFITWTKENRAPFTAHRYEEFCQDLVRFQPQKGFKVGSLPVRHLSTKHVTEWLASRPAWGLTTKRHYRTLPRI